MSWTGRAEVLADTSEMAAEAEGISGRCRATGLDPRSFRGVIGAAVALGAYPVHAAGAPWRSDRELITAICDLLDLIADRWAHYRRLAHAVATERARARAWLAASRRSAAHWRAVISDCTAALEILESLASRLTAAASRLTAVPEQLGETYAAVYALVASGRRMPLDGRWLSGEEPR